MAIARDSLLADRPVGWPAWCVSLTIHAGMLIAMLVWLSPPQVTGAADPPAREAGIVLKRMTDEGPQFEDEQSQPTADASAQSTAEDPTLAVLPNPAEFPRTDVALPRLPTLGPSALPDAQSTNVGELASGGAPSKQVGGKTTVRVFGLEGTGTRFVYVFDRSISMTGPPLRAAKQQLVASWDALDSIHQFQVIFFNHEPQAWDLTGGQARIAFATDANKRMAERFVRSVSATGGTFRRSALLMGLRMQPDVIFFLTDADDPMTSSDLGDAIRRAQNTGVSINTIEYGTGPSTSSENFLTRLASETGGRYVYVDTTQLAP